MGRTGTHRYATTSRNCVQAGLVGLTGVLIALLTSAVRDVGGILAGLILLGTVYIVVRKVRSGVELKDGYVIVRQPFARRTRIAQADVTRCAVEVFNVWGGGGGVLQFGLADGRRVRAQGVRGMRGSGRLGPVVDQLRSDLGLA